MDLKTTMRNNRNTTDLNIIKSMCIHDDFNYRTHVKEKIRIEEDLE